VELLAVAAEAARMPIAARFAPEAAPLLDPEPALHLAPALAR
jgi:hypothetical protein